MLFTIENPTPLVESEQLNKSNIKGRSQQKQKVTQSSLIDSKIDLGVLPSRVDVDNVLVQESVDAEDREILSARDILDAPPEVKALYVKDLDISKLGISHANDLKIHGMS